MTVDRRRLEKALQDAGLTKEQAERAVRAVLGEIQSALTAGRPAALRSFGTLHFKVSRRMKMWNPRSGAARPVNGGLLLRFSPARAFRLRIKVS